jgi:hypothetical protein
MARKGKLKKQLLVHVYLIRQLKESHLKNETIKRDIRGKNIKMFLHTFPWLKWSFKRYSNNINKIIYPMVVSL